MQSQIFFKERGPDGLGSSANLCDFRVRQTLLGVDVISYGASSMATYSSKNLSYMDVSPFLQ